LLRKQVELDKADELRCRQKHVADAS